MQLKEDVRDKMYLRKLVGEFRLVMKPWREKVLSKCIYSFFVCMRRERRRVLW